MPPRAACSWLTATGARRLRRQRPSASPPARRALRGPARRVGSPSGGGGGSPRLGSPLLVPSPPLSRLPSAPSTRRGPPSAARPFAARPGGCGRCHGAAHAGVQRLLLGQPGFQGAPEVSRDRAGEDEQVHQGADQGRQPPHRGPAK